MRVLGRGLLPPLLLGSAAQPGRAGAAQAFPAGAEKFFRGRFRDAPRVFNALRRAKSRCVLA
jgi:hypothetical protein